MPHIENTIKIKHTYAYVLLVFVKGVLVWLLKKTGYAWKETRTKFIVSQNVYFHFQCKSFYVKALDLS